MNPPNTQHITIDVNIERIVLVKFKQYCKNSQKLIITLTENQKKRPICIDTEKCIFKMITPDARPIYNETTINDDGTITVDITERCCTVAGNCLAELNIVDVADESLLCSMNISIVIVKSACEDELVVASPEFSYLTKLITENANINDSLNEMQNNFNDAEEIRKTNENVRIVNENHRIGNENNRVSAESDREASTANAVTNANNAATNANNVAKDAENATDAAIIATTDANKATQEANTVIESMKSLIANENVLHTDDMGVPGGVATLDKNGYIPSSQLPSYVDDILEGRAHGVVVDESTGSTTATSFTIEETDSLYTPENGKIYIDTDTNVQYRWSGRIYVSTGSPLSLGFTSSTAYPGDMGKTLEKEIDALNQYHNNIPATDIKFDNTNTQLLGANVQTALEDLTRTATRTRDGLLSADDKKLIDNYNGIQTIEVVLSASKWTGDSAPYTQLVPVSGLISYNSCSIELDPNATVLQETQIANANIYSISYDENNGITFVADGILPTADIPIILCVGASMNVSQVPTYLGDINDAKSISYNNNISKLSAENVQDGIDMLSTELSLHKTGPDHDNRYLLKTDLLNIIYPVGSIYTSVNNVDPGTILGGKWEQIKDRFLLSAGDIYKAGSLGGETAHVLTVTEMPIHTHGFSATSAYASNDHTHGFAATTGTVSADHAHSGFTSADGMHTHNMRIRRDNSASGGSDRIGNAGNHAEIQTSNMESAGYHSHSVQTYGIQTNHVHAVSGTTGGISTSHTHTVSGNTTQTGGGATHNNMPPYLAVYMWKRTA